MESALKYKWSYLFCQKGHWPSKRKIEEEQIDKRLIKILKGLKNIHGCFKSKFLAENFEYCLKHAENSVRLLSQHLPSDHMLLLSSKSVCALIKEEMAISNQVTLKVKD